MKTNQSVGAVLNSIETAVAIMIYVTIIQISIVAVLFSHAEFSYSSFAITSSLRLTFILQASGLCTHQMIKFYFDKHIC
jgi:hypothetical protein